MPETTLVSRCNKYVQPFVKKIVFDFEVDQFSFGNLCLLNPVLKELREQQAVALEIQGLPIAVKFKIPAHYINIDRNDQGHSVVYQADIIKWHIFIFDLNCSKDICYKHRCHNNIHRRNCVCFLFVVEPHKPNSSTKSISTFRLSIMNS